MAETTKPTTSGGVREAWSIVLLAVCVIIFLSLVSYDWRDIPLLQEPPNIPPANFIGPGGAWISFILFESFGLGAYLIPLWFLGFGIVLIFHGIEHVRAKLTWAVLMMVSLACFLELHASWFEPFMAALNMSAVGGIPAQFVARLISVQLLGDVGANILIIAIFLAASILFFGWDAILRLTAMLHETAGKLASRSDRDMLDSHKRQPAIKPWKRERLERVAAQEEQRLEDEEPEQRELIPLVKPAATKEPAKAASRIKEKAVVPEPEPEDDEEVSKPVPPPKPVVVAKPEPKPAPPPPPPPIAMGSYQLPPISLLTEVPTNRQGAVQADTDATGRLIVQTLEEFGIKTELKMVECGPAVARYELIPAPGVKVEKIVAPGVLVGHELFVGSLDQKEHHANLFGVHQVAQFGQFRGMYGRCRDIPFFNRDHAFGDRSPDDFSQSPVARVVEDEKVFHTAAE